MRLFSRNKIVMLVAVAISLVAFNGCGGVPPTVGTTTNSNTNPYTVDTSGIPYGIEGFIPVGLLSPLAANNSAYIYSGNVTPTNRSFAPGNGLVGEFAVDGTGHFVTTGLCVATPCGPFTISFTNTATLDSSSVNNPGMKLYYGLVVTPQSTGAIVVYVQ